MANEQLLVTLGVQDKGATTQIRALNKELKSLDTQYKLASKSGDGFDKSVDGLQKKLGLLEQKMTAQTTKLNTYKKQIEEAKAGIQRKTEELEKLKNSQKDNTKAIEKTEKQLNTYRNQLKNAENSVKETEAQIQLLTEEIENTNKAIKNFDTNKMSNQLKEVGQNIGNFANKLDNAGQTIDGIGNKLIALSAPITAFAGYATHAGIAFENSMAKTGALAGATAEEFDRLEKHAKGLGESIAGASAADVADSFGYLALAGYSVNEMIDAIEPNVKASIAWEEDMATNTDLVTDSLSSLGLQASDTTYYLDTLTKAQNSSNTSGQQLLEAYVGVGGMFKSFNTPLAESTALLGVLANRGIKGSEAGKALNSILINLMGTTSTTEGALKKLGVSAYDAEGNFRGVETTLRDVSASMKNMTQEQEDLLSAQLGGKTQIDTLKALLAGLDEEYDSLKATISDSTGALEAMYETMSGTTAGKIETFKSTLEGLGLQIADNLLPHINDLLEAGMSLIKWFGSLDSETQKTIINLGLFATASGGALKIFGNSVSDGSKVVSFMGKVTKSFGESEKASNILATGASKVVTAFGKLGIGLPAVVGAVGVLSAGVYAYNEVQDAMNKSIVTAKEDMSLLEKATLALQGVQSKSKDELVKMGLVYEDFNNNISSNFQDTVKEMTKDVQEFGFALNDMNLDGVISESEVSGVLDKVGGLVDGIERTIRTNSSKVQNALYEMYNSDGVIDETEANLLTYWNNRTETEVNKANDLENAIKDILNQAKGRELTNEEITSIQNYYAQLKQLELELQADNSYELEYAKSEFQNRIKTLDAEGAQELLQQRYKQYEDERISIESHYDAMIAQVQAGNTELTEEDQKLIADMEAKKQEKLAVNQQYWDEAYNYTISSNENLVGVINKYNGEILSATDKNYYDRYVLAQQNLQGLNEITETGYQTMLDTTTGKYVDMYAVVDEKTGQLQGLYNLNTGAVSAMSSESAKEIEKLYTQWSTSSDGIVTKNLTLQGSYLDTSNNIVTSNGKVIGSLGQVQDKAGNLQSAILDLNGNPIKVGDNAAEVIEKLQNTKREVNNLDGSKATVKVDDGGSINSLGSRLKNMFSNLFGGGKSYAIGTNNAPQGIHTVNEKGWELIDAPRGKMAVGLGENAIGETAYLPRGTKVRTNLASTELMMQEIKKEVSNQISKIDFSHQYYKPQQVQTRVQETTSKVQNNADNELLNSMNTMITLLAQLVNKDTDIYIDSRKVGKTLATVVDEQIAKRARGRI